jgi:hypothetical protein
MGREKKIKTIEDKHLFDKASGVAIATSVLAKCYEAGELVWKEDLKKKQKKDRSKIKPEVRGIYKILFLDTYMRMPKPTINGAIQKMLKGHSKGDYIFKNVTSKIPSLKASTIREQKKFLEKQVTYIWGTKPKLDKWIRINITGEGNPKDPLEQWGTSEPEER